jgi:hypothetical protein
MKKSMRHTRGGKRTHAVEDVFTCEQKSRRNRGRKEEVLNEKGMPIRDFKESAEEKKQKGEGKENRIGENHGGRKIV